jgi:hypothetical protein
MGFSALLDHIRFEGHLAVNYDVLNGIQPMNRSTGIRNRVQRHKVCVKSNH